MPDPSGFVGRDLRLKFTSENATPDLHEMGEVAAQVTRVELEGAPPSEKITAKVESPSTMNGLTVALRARYEGESLAAALQGAWVTVEAFFTDAGGRAVAGGIGTMTFKAP